MSWDAVIRRKALERYGGKCACCDEANYLFLTIDHVKNDGAEHRIEMVGGGHSIFRWLSKMGYPENFQVLCWNCQHGKRMLGECQSELHFICD